ncbi:MAG TPA: methyltransferase domain-containing protein [Actinomycetota bacterium]|nr:methyltransferase domain-containing protein [Actinomycetota bacterium]
MAVSGLIFIGLLTFALLIWLIVVSDGRYFGTRGVRFVYQRSARFWNLDEAPTRERSRSRSEANTTLLHHLETCLDGLRQPKVLDIATGTGRVPLLIAGIAGFDGHVTGVDISRNMLARGRAIIRSEGLEDQIALVESDGADLPFDDGSFDLVCLVDAPLARPRRTLDEMVRVLTPAGRSLIAKQSDRWVLAVPGMNRGSRWITRWLTQAGMADVDVETWHGGNIIITARKPREGKGQESSGLASVGPL